MDKSEKQFLNCLIAVLFIGVFAEVFVFNRESKKNTEKTGQ